MVVVVFGVNFCFTFPESAIHRGHSGARFIMNQFSIFLAKHSQKLALLCAATACSLSYYVQPYYEVLCRWSVTQFDIEWEAKPSERILRITKEVCSHFNMTDYQKSQLDIFLTPIDESLVLGSLRSPGYAFIGLPYFFGYESSTEISLDSLDFYRPYFPYGPFSKIGKDRLDLMNLPESALKFLIAREIVRLQGVTVVDQKLPLSARSQSLLTSNSIIGSLYLSYQTIFLLNRTITLPLRVSIASRTLIYTFISLFGLFFQHQMILAWRRYCCLRADQIVCSLGESFRQGGLQYYDWRIRWNKFWAERQEEFKERKRLIKKSNHNGAARYDPVMKYQLEIEKSAGKNTTETDYYLPKSEDIPLDLSIIKQQLLNDKNRANINYLQRNRFNNSGNELWSGDGDGINLGWTGILSIGIIPKIISSLFNLFSTPATSSQRYHQLNELEVKTIN
ncbi:unnamed protein product [Schistosoma rodhaini]|uniref:Uncharacterized protein n=1 Tax=Schistosoma rodhaini TaxID=6188 RepID=A0AA85GG72_9TREM|nr:unnamed protein product [Schistosoma rodhaini]